MFIVIFLSVYGWLFEGEDTPYAEKLFSFSINSVSNTQQIGSTIFGEQTDENFVVVTFSVKNNSNSKITLYSSNCKLKIDNATYEPITILSGVDNPLNVLEDIGSGITKQVTAVFEIPLSLKNSKKSLQITINHVTQSYNL